MTALPRYDHPAVDQATEHRCGACVVFCGHGDGLFGDCSILGVRMTAEPACRRFFGKEQLNAPNYGRKE